MQHALYWARPGGPSSLYMASPQSSYGTTSDTGQWGYIDIACPAGTWQWQPVVYIWINNQYMGPFPGHWGGFTACKAEQLTNQIPRTMPLRGRHCSCEGDVVSG